MGMMTPETMGMHQTAPEARNSAGEVGVMAAVGGGSMATEMSVYGPIIGPVAEERPPRANQGTGNCLGSRARVSRQKLGSRESGGHVASAQASQVCTKNTENQQNFSKNWKNWNSNLVWSVGEEQFISVQL